MLRWLSRTTHCSEYLLFRDNSFFNAKMAKQSSRRRDPRRLRFGMGGGRHASRRVCTQERGVVKTKKRSFGTWKVNAIRGVKLTLGRIRDDGARHGVNKLEDIARWRLPRYSVSSRGQLTLKFGKLPEPTLDGNRIINLQSLQQHVGVITKHAVMCSAAQSLILAGESPIRLITEVRRMGLASVLMARCDGCKQEFRLETSPKITTSSGAKRYEVNVRAVWGTMCTGGGAAHLSETMATLNAPGMSQPTFTAIEDEIGKWWQSVMEEELTAAGVEERKLAMERNDYHQGVPAVSVICDGGWSKRTHKHSYNAVGGVAIIIGAATKKLLHIGIRNKSCYICSRAEATHSEPGDHECFKNWNQSSQAMEADIIVEGFLQAEERHGLRYMRLIADGDSSVYARIQERVSVWGRSVKKLECANHVCKCLRSSLEKLVTEKPAYKGSGKLTQNTRVRLTSAVRCAIKMRSAESDRQKALKWLKHDIMNSIHHIFGCHYRCSDFCKARKQSKEHADGGEEKNDTDETIPDVMQDQLSFWTEGTSADALEESRLSGSLSYASLDKSIIRDVSVLLERVASKADRLLGNFTSNLAECWMSIRGKFDGGKFYNRCNRGSWYSRCFGGALRMNLGMKWSPTVWEKVTGSPAGSLYHSLYKTRQYQSDITQRLQQQPEVKQARWKRKHRSAAASNTKKAKLEYGPQAVDVVEDCSKEDLQKASSEYLNKHVHLDTEKLDAIARCSVQQSASGVWMEERRKRLTSSNFGCVISRKPSIKVEPLVRRLLYGTFSGTQHTRWGLSQEDVTIDEYIIHQARNGKNVSVQKMGLVISPDYPYLAASPDGKVKVTGSSDCGLLEIKNVLKDKPIGLASAAATVKDFCLQIVGQELKLKRSHQYYFQCQGQLNILNLPWLHFVVRTVNPHDLHVETICVDKELWNQKMLPKLTAFYHSAILPELAVSRHGKSPGIR